MAGNYWSSLYVGNMRNFNIDSYISGKCNKDKNYIKKKELITIVYLSKMLRMFRRSIWTFGTLINALGECIICLFLYFNVIYLRGIDISYAKQGNLIKY